MTYVKSSLFGNKSDLFSFIGDIFFKALDKLFDSSDISDVKEENNPNGDKYGKGASFKVKDEFDNTINVAVFPEKERGKNTVILEMNGEQEEFKDVDSDDVVPTIKKFVEEISGGTVNMNTNASKKIYAKFKRVCASTEDSIELISVKCDADPHTALMVIDNVMNDDDLMAEVTEDGTSFEIVDDGSELTAEVCDDNACCCECDINPFEYMLLYGYAYWSTLKGIHWNAKGYGFEKLHRYTDNDADIHRQTDMLSEWAVQFYGKVPDMVYFMSKLDPLNVDEGFCYEDGIKAIQAAQISFIDAMRLKYSEVAPEIQSVLDDWIVEYTKEAHYFLERPQL